MVEDVVVPHALVEHGAEGNGSGGRCQGRAELHLPVRSSVLQSDQAFWRNPARASMLASDVASAQRPSRRPADNSNGLMLGAKVARTWEESLQELR